MAATTRLQRLVTAYAGGNTAPEGASIAIEGVEPGGNGNPEPIPTFITPQSIVTFPVASLVVTLTWQIAAKLWDRFSAQWVAVFLAMLVGWFIYYISDKSGLDAKGRRIALVLAFINALFLAASAIGLDTALPGNPGVAGR